MATIIKYCCDLCGGVVEEDNIIGLIWRADGSLQECYEKIDIDKHLCLRCYCGIREIGPYCIHGFECDGGLNCTSDHK